MLALASAAPAADVADCHLVAGWEQQGGARRFTADNLFEYLNGNAEGYLLYGFVQMQGVTCQSGGDSILIDVFEMADADSAYGVFTANLDPHLPIEKVGMAGQIMPRRALFCKDKYYVELATNLYSHSLLASKVIGLPQSVEQGGSWRYRTPWSASAELPAYSATVKNFT